jgi:hypothetical protein
VGVVVEQWAAALGGGECATCARDTANGRAAATADAAAALAARDASLAALPLPLRRLLSRRSNHSGGCPAHLLRERVGSSSSGSSSSGSSSSGSSAGGGRRLGTAAEQAVEQADGEQADGDFALALSLQDAEGAGEDAGGAAGGGGVDAGRGCPLQPGLYFALPHAWLRECVWALGG